MNSMNRRDFMFRSGLTTAAGTVALRAGNKVLWASDPGPASVPPSDRVRGGIIGSGMRSYAVAGSFLAAPGTEVVAAADVYDSRLTRAKEVYGEKLETTKDYRRILDRKDIDVVLIATPDHWHKRMIVEAMGSGKDVYCEKPMTYTVHDGFEIMDAEKRYSKILCVGYQGVSSPLAEIAKKWIAEGKIGQITQVKSWENRNTVWGACYYPIAPDASERTIDWKNWLGSAPDRPFDARRYFRWRIYWDYSGGMATDLGMGFLDLVNYLFGSTIPQSAICYGGSYRWKEIYPETEIPDVVDMFFEYPNFTCNVSINLNTENQDQGSYFMGTKGTIYLDLRRLTLYPEHPLEHYGWIVNAWPEAMQKQFIKQHNIVELDRTWAPGTCTSMEKYEHYEIVGELTDVHVKNFLESVRTRKPSLEGAVEGHNAAVGAHMANKSYREGRRKVMWDGKQVNVV